LLTLASESGLSVFSTPSSSRAARHKPNALDKNATQGRHVLPTRPEDVFPTPPPNHPQKPRLLRLASPQVFATNSWLPCHLSCSSFFSTLMRPHLGSLEIPGFFSRFRFLLSQTWSLGLSGIPILSSVEAWGVVGAS